MTTATLPRRATRTLNGDETAREAARASQDDARRHDASIAAFFDLLGSAMPRAWRCDASDPDLWWAWCPECTTDAALLVRQTSTGRVHLQCTARLGCSERGILRALHSAADHRDPWAQAEQWRHIAEDAHALAVDLHRQLTAAVA